MRWSLLLFFICSACQSKPVVKTESPSSEVLEAKVTREAPAQAKAEYGVKVLQSPRKEQELEAGILGHPEVRKCIDQAAVDPAWKLDVMLEGKISGTGAIEGPVLKKASKSLERCMNPALSALNLGNGKAGPFKMQIFGKVGKNQLKKFE